MKLSSKIFTGVCCAAGGYAATMVGGAIGRNAAKQEMASDHNTNTEAHANMLRSVVVMQKQLPLRVNEHTQIGGLAYTEFNNSLTYSYVYDGPAFDESEKTAAQTAFTTAYCTTPSIKQFRDLGVSMIRNFHSDKGAFIMQATAKSSDCLATAQSAKPPAG